MKLKKILPYAKELLKTAQAKETSSLMRQWETDMILTF